MSQAVLELDPVAAPAPGVPAGASPVRAVPAAPDFDAVLALVRQAEAAPDGQAQGRDAAAWWRLALMRSFVTPLPHARAAALPLILLPPPGLQPVNPVQALQARISSELARPGGVQRLRPLAERLADAAARLDFHRFVGALLPRLIEASAGAAAPRAAIESAWGDPLVQRRWCSFALRLDAHGAAALLRVRPAAARRVSGDNRRSAFRPEARRWPSTSSKTSPPISPPACGSPTAPA